MRKITKDDFVISQTPTGYSVKWKHNLRTVKHFGSPNSRIRARAFIRFLVGFYDKEGYRFDFNRIVKD